MSHVFFIHVCMWFNTIFLPYLGCIIWICCTEPNYSCLLKLVVLYPLDLYTEVPVACTIEICCPTVLEARSPKSKVMAGLVPSEFWEGDSTCGLTPRHVRGCLLPSPLPSSSLYIFESNIPILKGHQSYWIRCCAHDLTLTWLPP
jgi:hypothetical protein